MEPPARVSRALRPLREPGTAHEAAPADARGGAIERTAAVEHHVVAGLHERHPQQRRSYRPLSVLDEGNCEAVAIEANFSLPSTRVIAVLDGLGAQPSALRRLRCNNGSEFISDALGRWCKSHVVTLAYIEPGKPNQNAYIALRNRRFREGAMEAWLLTTLFEVGVVSEEQWEGCNTERSHERLGNVPPRIFLQRPTHATPYIFKVFV